LDNLVATIQGNLESEGKDGWRSIASEDKKLRGQVSHNVDAVAKRLADRSKIVRKAVESGQVKIVPAIYGLETGHVDFWEVGETRKPASAHAH
jgi:carbonic anhydrase